MKSLSLKAKTRFTALLNAELSQQRIKLLKETRLLNIGLEWVKTEDVLEDAIL